MYYTIYFENANHHYVNIDFELDTKGTETIVFHLPAWRPEDTSWATLLRTFKIWAAYDEKRATFNSSKTY